MLKKIVIIIAVTAAALVGIIAIQPSEFKVERDLVMSAPPVAVFPYVNDFHKWDAWSPWAKIDPQAKVNFEGMTAGKGAIFKWDGNDDVGQGQMTIVESTPPESIQIKLDFVRPFSGTNDVQFSFKPQENGTLVTWTMSGHNGFVAKAVNLVMDCEKMIGDMYEEGLKNMKSIVETPSGQQANQQE